jgi:hypothetical protein
VTCFACLVSHKRGFAGAEAVYWHGIECLAVLWPLQLAPEKQRAIAEELDRTPGEVLKKLEDIRNKIL